MNSASQRIAGRVLRSFFTTPLFFVIAALTMLLCGFFFFTLIQQFGSVVRRAAMTPDLIPNLNEYVIMPFYQTLLFVVVCLIPLLVMSSFPRERQLGAYELLCTAPLRISSLVSGMFRGLYGVLFAILLTAFFFPLMLLCYANPEAAPIFVGFLGVLLFSAALLSVGLAVASICRSQTTAAFASFFVLFALYLLDVPAQTSSGTAAGLLRALSPAARTMNFLQGVVQVRDVVFLLSLTALGLFISRRVLEIDRWR